MSDSICSYCKRKLGTINTSVVDEVGTLYLLRDRSGLACPSCLLDEAERATTLASLLWAAAQALSPFAQVPGNWEAVKAHYPANNLADVAPLTIEPYRAAKMIADQIEKSRPLWEPKPDAAKE